MQLEPAPESQVLEALRSSVPICKELLERAPELLYSKHLRQVGMRTAAGFGQSGAIRHFMSLGWDPAEDGGEALFVGAGHAEVLQAFFDAGAPPMAFHGEILVQAAASRSESAFELCLSHLEIVPNGVLLAALNAAIANGAVPAATRIIGMNPAVGDDDWVAILTSVKAAGLEGPAPALLRALASLGLPADQTARELVGQSVEGGAIETIRTLLELGVDLQDDACRPLQLIFSSDNQQAIDLTVAHLFDRQLLSESMLHNLVVAKLGMEASMLRLEAGMRGYAIPPS